MGIAIDVLIGLFLLWSLWRGWRHGLLYQLAQIAMIIVAYFAARGLGGLLADPIASTGLAPIVASTIGFFAVFFVIFVVGSLFSILTERADLRTWTTLPDTWQAARLLVEPGQIDLTLHAVGGQYQDLGVFELQPGETLFLLARTVGATLHVHSIGGRYVASEVAPEPTTNP